MRTIERTGMSATIAVAKLTQVNRMVFDATASFRGSRTSQRNTKIFLQARSMAAEGRTNEAFTHMALAVVPAGSVPACCGLRSAQYGCSTHGYPRVK